MGGFLTLSPARSSSIQCAQAVSTAPATAAHDLLGEILPGLGERLVSKRDQMEVIDCDGRAGQPHAQHFAEPEEPVPDTLVVPSVGHAQELAGIQVHDRAIQHPNRAAVPLVSNDTNSNPHEPRRARKLVGLGGHAQSRPLSTYRVCSSHVCPRMDVGADRLQPRVYAKERLHFEM